MCPHNKKTYSYQNATIIKIVIFLHHSTSKETKLRSICLKNDILHINGLTLKYVWWKGGVTLKAFAIEFHNIKPFLV